MTDGCIDIIVLERLEPDISFCGRGNGLNGEKITRSIGKLTECATTLYYYIHTTLYCRDLGSSASVSPWSQPMPSPERRLGGCSGGTGCEVSTLRRSLPVPSPTPRVPDMRRDGSPDKSSLPPSPSLLIRLLSLILGRVTGSSPSDRSPVRCQISSVRSDFIYIIALGLCLLFSPAVTPVITSNVILPMDAALPGKSPSICLHSSINTNPISRRSDKEHMPPGPGLSYR